MGERSAIEWTDHTFNPWIGCMKVSPGCKHCYAMVETYPRVQRSRGRELWGPPATTDRHVTADANWRKPVQWNTAAERAGERARVFCASMADVFEDHPSLPATRARLWSLIEATPWLDWQLLTKRPENVRRMVPLAWHDGFPSNVWLGTSIEDQERADERIPHLLGAPAAIRFLSCEPLLGPVDLPSNPSGVQWVIIGGESGANARPFHVAWARDLIQQCREIGAAPFVKQIGAHIEGDHMEFCVEQRWFGPGWRFIPPLIGAHTRTRPEGATGFGLTDPKGGKMGEWPADLRVREMPTPKAPSK